MDLLSSNHLNNSNRQATIPILIVNDDFAAEQPNTRVKTIIKKLFFAYLFRERQITEKIIVWKKNIDNASKSFESTKASNSFNFMFYF